MAWKPKTIAGKILKGAVIAGGSVLALATGVKVGIIAGGAVKRAVNTVKDRAISAGTTALANVGKSVNDNIQGTIDKVGESAINVLSGGTKDQRQTYNKVKTEARSALAKVIEAAKLVRAGKTPEEARAIVGANAEEMTTLEGEPIKQAGLFDMFQNKTVLIVFGAIVALVLLSKRRR